MKLVVEALLRRPVPRTPVWLMRQAGRYLPEFRAVREKTSFLEACRTPHIAAELTLQPLRRFPLDAAILFSDILIPLEAMGARVEFGAGGPKIVAPIRDAKSVDALRVPDAVETMGFVGEALKLVRRELPEETALLGFAGAPWTLLAYLVDGGGDRGFPEAKRFCYAQPAAAEKLLGMLADTVAAHLAAQVHAGADAVQIFDTWAGELAPEDWDRFAGPFLARVVKAVKPLGAPVIVFALGTGALLEKLAALGADAVGVDWRTTMAEARRRAPGVALQGNLDPHVLLGPREQVVERTRAVLRSAGSAPGYVFNLGHGVVPAVPPENVGALVETVRAWQG